MKILSILCFFWLFYSNIATAEGYLPQRIEQTSPTEHLIYTFTYDNDNRPASIEKEILESNIPVYDRFSVYDYTYNPDNTIKQVVLSTYTSRGNKKQKKTVVPSDYKEHGELVSEKTFNYEYQYIKDTIQITISRTEVNQLDSEKNSAVIPEQSETSTSMSGISVEHDDTKMLPLVFKIVASDSSCVLINVKKEMHPLTGYYSETTKIDFVNGDVIMTLSDEHYPEVHEMILHQDGKEGIYKYLNWPLYLKILESDTGLPDLLSIQTNTTSIEKKDYPNNPLLIFEYDYNEYNYPSKVYVQDKTYQIEYMPAN